MWKKPFKPGKSNLIKSSEKRKLKEKLLAAFPALTSESLDQLLPNKEDIHETKVTGSRTVIYSKNEEPLFFDLEGRGEPKNFFPTVYALWKLPPFLPSFEIHAPVFKYISQGADLMLPGVVAPSGGFEPFAERSKRVIQIVGTKTPLGIGITQCTDASIAANGMKGKGLMMTHFYTDYLWRMGPKTHPKLDMITDDIDSDAEIDEEAAARAEAAQNQTEDAPTEAVPGANPDEPEKPTDDPTIHKEIETTSTQPESTQPSTEAPEVEDDKVPVELVDALVQTTFLQALKRRVKDADLPMLVSAFYSQLFLPCRPIGTNINLKRSSWKKFNTFLQQKAEEHLIELDEPTPGVVRILSINRGHDDFVAFRPLPVAATVEGAEKANAEANDDGADEKSGPQIREAFQLPKHLHALIPDDVPTSTLFDASECAALLWDYVAANNLNAPEDTKKVALDNVLASALFPKELHAAGDAPVIVEKKQLAQRFKEKLLKVNEVTIDGIKQVKKGELGKVAVIVEPRQGRKWMTRVQGLEKFGVDPKEVAKVGPKKFAASATVAKLPGKTKVELLEVLIQGQFGDEVAEMLEAEFNIPAKYIELSGAGARGKGRK